MTKTPELLEQHCRQETDTAALAQKLAASISRFLVDHPHQHLNISLIGDLGAGKTTFARYLIQSLGYVGKVKSPTYTLVEPYQLTINKQAVDFYHFDLYRFADEEEWEAAGFREYFNAHSICLVEWPDKAGDLIPQADIDVYLSLAGEGRSMELQANTTVGKQCLDRYTDS